ncbi:MAG TPA: hypothetical protein VKP30_07560, partial [Polyangiaceae bacterium]|nr:hypothetical protein [Polyangiaceae bacterium]
RMRAPTLRHPIRLRRSSTTFILALWVCSGCRIGYERTERAEVVAGSAGKVAEATAGGAGSTAGATSFTFRGGTTGVGTTGGVAGGSGNSSTRTSAGGNAGGGYPGSVIDANGGHAGSAVEVSGGNGGHAGSAVEVSGGRGGDAGASSAGAGAGGVACRCPLGQGCVGSSCVAGRIVFVTSAVVTAKFGGITGADLLCADLARTAGLSGQYLVWMSDSSTSPATRFAQSGAPYVLVNGTVIANDWADLVDGQLAAPINVDEHGNPTFAAEVWTGSSADGTAATDTCADWTSTDPTVYGQQGVTDRADTGWSNVYLQFCDRALIRLMCFQQ